jgi:hypothetical protein
MAYYAKIDRTKKQPAQIIGYYDTALKYTEDFTSTDFIELSQADWDNRKMDSYHKNGKLIDKPAMSDVEKKATALMALKARASALLTATNDEALLAIETDGNVSADLKAYRAALRDVINGKSYELPIR